MTKSRDQEQHKHSIFCRFELTLDVYVENTFWYGPFGSFAKINHQVEPMRVKHSRDDALCRLIHVCMYILQLSMMIHIIATDTGTANTLVPCTQINRYSKFVCSARSVDNIPKFNTIYGFVCVWFVCVYIFCESHFAVILMLSYSKLGSVFFFRCLMGSHDITIVLIHQIYRCFVVSSDTKIRSTLWWWTNRQNKKKGRSILLCMLFSHLIFSIHFMSSSMIIISFFSVFSLHVSQSRGIHKQYKRIS